MVKLVICAGMPRSGSTLQYRIVKEVLKSRIEFIDLGWIGNQNLYEIIDANKDTEKIILLKTHDYINGITPLIDEKHLYVFSTYRDIRDIFVSLIHFKKTSFEEVFSEYEFLKITHNYNKWLQHQNFFSSRYENFFHNIPMEVKKVAKHLNIEIEAMEVNNIAKLLNAERQDNTIISERGYDQDSLLHKNHINNGSWGQWQTQLTNLQIGIIQYYAKDWLLKHNYSLKKTIYNNPVFWKGAKVLKHVRQGTLSERLKDDYNSKTQRKIDFLSNKSDHVFSNIDSRVKIKLYKNSKLARSIYTGDFENSERKFLINYLKKGDVFFDVGANIGLFSLTASTIIGSQGTIHAFEPSSETFEKLEENVRINLLDNILLNRFALSDKKEKLKFFTDKSGCDAWNSLGKPTIGNLLVEEEIDTLSLDLYVEQNQLEKIDLIKIDVEGWEVPVFKGAKNLFTSSNAPTLLVEFTDQNAINAGFSCRDLFNLGIKYGFQWFTYDEKLNDIIIESPREEYPYINLIATKSPSLVKQRIQQK